MVQPNVDQIKGICFVFGSRLISALNLLLVIAYSTYLSRPLSISSIAKMPPNSQQGFLSGPDPESPASIKVSDYCESGSLWAWSGLSNLTPFWEEIDKSDKFTILEYLKYEDLPIKLVIKPEPEEIDKN